jgi:hypothetical protein
MIWTTLTPKPPTSQTPGETLVTDLKCDFPRRIPRSNEHIERRVLAGLPFGEYPPLTRVPVP